MHPVENLACAAELQAQHRPPCPRSLAEWISGAPAHPTYLYAILGRPAIEPCGHGVIDPLSGLRSEQQRMHKCGGMAMLLSTRVHGCDKLLSHAASKENQHKTLLLNLPCTSFDC